LGTGESVGVIMLSDPNFKEVRALAALERKSPSLKYKSESRNPTPYTQHPAPYTQHPAPCTLQYTPYTQHPAPHIPHPHPARATHLPPSTRSAPTPLECTHPARRWRISRGACTRYCRPVTWWVARLRRAARCSWARASLLR
jgi:hypothetical protein